MHHDFLGPKLSDLGVTLLAALLSSACSPGDALHDKLRGHWEVVSYRCGTEVYTRANVPTPASIAITFAGESAEVAFSDSFCQAVERWAALYEDDSLLTLRDGKVSCAPDPCTKLTGDRCSARSAGSAAELFVTVRFTNAAATQAAFDFLDDCHGTGEPRPATLTLHKRPARL